MLSSVDRPLLDLLLRRQGEASVDLATNQPTVDYLRDQGFMQGFGIDVKDPNKYGDENDPRICDHEMSQGDQEKGRTAMENALQKCPDVSIVYTINEPAAAGAYEALKAVGKEKDVLLVSVDGGCPGVKNVKAGIIGATSMQFPLLMASKGIDAVAEYAKSGKKPELTPGLDFYNTGVELITDKPVSGLPSLDSTQGLAKCWG
jgi:fructose transport system substrate-binding protein